MSGSALDFRNLSYRYPGTGGPALRDVNLRVAAGEFVVLAGRSAAGKSTLLRAASGLIPHFHGGEIAGDAGVCGHDLRTSGPADLAGSVGLVAQDPETQLVSATVRAELELPLEIRGEPAPARARAVEEVSLALGIAHLLDRSTSALSGGEIQRVALAAALVGRPRLICLDEPTSQLDPVAGDELIGLLRRLNEEWGTAVVLAEHRLERCLAAADRVVAMAEGRIAFDGRPAAYLDWALAADSALATPLARLFDMAGLRPLPVSVKEARAAIAARGGEAAGVDTEPPAPRRAAGTALRAKRLRVELARGGGRAEVLRGLELRIDRGELVALMGRNGAGKTTLLRAMAGLVPCTGRIETPGGWALVPQNPSDLFVREQVGEELPGAAGAEALAAVGLEHTVGTDPRDLSGGERQRLAIAIAMAGRGGGGMPGIVCLDEPTRGMDTARKADLAADLAAIAADGPAILVATHDVEFAAAYADRVVLMGDGVVLADGPAADVLSGGWYFATEVARALGAAGPVTPAGGAALLAERAAAAPRSAS